MVYEKVYVKVLAEFSLSGGMIPTAIVWRDGERYYIDRVKEKVLAPCRSGGILTTRYTVVVYGKEKYLYYEKDKERFFVERELL